MNGPSRPRPQCSRHAKSAKPRSLYELAGNRDLKEARSPFPGFGAEKLHRISVSCLFNGRPSLGRAGAQHAKGVLDEGHVHDVLHLHLRLVDQLLLLEKDKVIAQA